ncbi:Tudor domain-containing protein 3 [Glycine soja]|uniref:Tudor domain-containing protein 3 n=1 Tax=Glycine soja TaxID=3848 RepID=A0A0B2S052_GLYSO|nr:Tudor domain-containing protein 3 [Glycine soja]RZC16645.1 Tudor domain-containing protein 3 [Glycine soja]
MMDENSRGWDSGGGMVLETLRKRGWCLEDTDGHYEITTVEYSHIPSIPNNVVLGTKIHLENKVAVHSGIVCLNPKVLTVLGGVVQSLYEEWEMNQKYSGFSRSSLRKLENRDTGGPPQFVKLQVGSSSGIADYNSSRSCKPIGVVGEAELRPTSTADYNSSRSCKPIAVVGEAGLRPTDFHKDPNQKAMQMYNPNHLKKELKTRLKTKN